MKPISTIILLAGLAGGFSATAIEQAADETATNAPAATPAAAAVTGDAVPQPAETTATASTPTASSLTATNDPAADFAAGKGLRMNFRQVPLDLVLNYMSKAAGFVIRTGKNVNVTGKVDVWADQPLSKAEAVTLLKQIMSDNGYAVLENGRFLTIIPTIEAKKNDLQVLVAKNPSDIPKDAEMVTEIIPVQSLNVVQLARDLSPMLDNPLTAQESGNSLIMTDTRQNVRRIVEIVKALDSVSSSVNSIEVFQLVYADAKTIATLIKDLFPSSDSSGRGGGGAGQRFGRGGGGGFPGGGAAGGFAAMFGGAGGGGAPSTGSTPTTRVSAVADDHSNSLIVSAPDDLLELVRQVVKQVDVSVQDLTAVTVFKLKNADPVEMADLLTNLFPDENNTGNATGPQFMFGGFGGGGRGGNAARGGGRGGASGTTSDRLQKLARVVAVPDRRTGSVVVTASKDLMDNIKAMVEDLDSNSARKMKIFTFDLKNADPQEIQTLLQEVIPMSTASGRSANTTTTTSALQQRATTLLNQQNSSTQSGFGTTGSSGTPGRAN